MGEFRQSVWAPWRVEYLEQLADQQHGCFICRYRDTPAQDEANFVLRRSEHSLLILNRYPYTSGHVLVAPLSHTGEIEELPDDVLLDLMCRARDAKRVLQAALGAQGFNIGLNLGGCAGAGLPGHLHWHIVPRWNGDTNFMPVIGDVKVIPQALQRVQQEYDAAAVKLGL